MEKIENLKKQIEDLESELLASMKREEMRVVANGSGSLKQKIKNKIKSTRLWRAADDPNDKLGKVIRSPRTIVRVITNPSVAKEIREKNRHIKDDKKNEERIFMPIRFFFGEGSLRRVNVMLTEIDLELIRMGIVLADKEALELRVVTTKEKIDAVWYRKMIKDKKLPKFNNISFYNAMEQNIRAKVFELEISENDIFLTKAWNYDERR